MDASTIVGIVLGLGAILLGHVAEGGHLSSLMQLTAGLIVFGGTLGATVLANTRRDLLLGVSLLGKAFASEDDGRRMRIAMEIIEAAKVARRESILSLEKRLTQFSEPFMREVFRFLVDGVEPETLKSLFNGHIRTKEDRGLAGAKVWSDAGGFAPTIGIIGAVLGLIHVMSNIENTMELGKGIAVAFVATIYGVGSANLLFIPIATKIKRKALAESDLNKMIVDGAAAIGSGLNPYLVAEKVQAYVDQRLPKDGE